MEFEKMAPATQRYCNQSGSELWSYNPKFNDFFENEAIFL